MILPLRPADAQPARVLARDLWCEPREWSRDSSRLLVTVEDDDAGAAIAVVNVVDGSVRVVRPINYWDRGGMSLSPDGLFVAYDRRAAELTRERDIVLLPIDGGAETVLLGGPSSDSVVGWSTTGSQLIFISNRAGRPGLWALPVSAGRASGDPVLLRADFSGSPAGLTDEGALLYEQRRLGSPSTGVFVAELDQADGTVTSTPSFAAHDRQEIMRFPRWSTDGHTLLYITSRPDGPVLSLHSEATRQVRELPLDLSYVWSFDVSPNGRWAAFHGISLADQGGIFLLDIETSELRLIAKRSVDAVTYFRPRFSRDEDTLWLFQAAQGPKGPAAPIHLVEWSPALHTETKVNDIGLNALPSGGRMRTRSPNGELIAATVEEEGRSRLVVVDVTTGGVRDVLRVDWAGAFNRAGVGHVEWLPDGDALVAGVVGTCPARSSGLKASASTVAAATPPVGRTTADR